MRLIAAIVCAGLMILRPEDLPWDYRPWTPLDLDAAPNVVWRTKVRAMGYDTDMCRTALAQSPARAEAMSDREHSDVCHIRDRVRLTGLSRARLAPVETRCEIAARLYLWDRLSVQPAAERHLGTRVTGIYHFSSYSCRQMRTSRGTSFRMSQHATANAIDISGFRLADGRSITLLRDWDGDAAKAAFLREVRDGLCDWFNITLSPDYNRLHADHFHADMGPFLTCR
ncbi:MAG: extensin family protein [Pseudomonadota bacterium]